MKKSATKKELYEKISELEKQISELKFQNKKLNKSDYFLKDALLTADNYGEILLDQVPFIIFISSTEGVLWVNNAVYSILGYTREELINLPKSQTLSLFSLESISSVLDSNQTKFLITENNTLMAVVEFRIKTKHGQWKWFYSTYHIVENDERKYFIGICIDITYSKIKEIQAKDEIDTLNQMHNKEIKQYKNEINTLLQTIYNYKKTIEISLNNINQTSLKGLNESGFTNILEHIKREFTASLHIENKTPKYITDYKSSLTPEEIAALSPTQRKIHALAKRDYSNKEISDLLHISIRTVESHKFNIKKKLKDL